jgi:hypothetical protein
MPVDVSQALDLRLNHKLAYSDIAAIQGTSKQAVHRAIKALLPPPDIKTYHDNRADILSGLQVKLLSHVDDARLKKTPVGTLVLAACQLYDKERIERGQLSSITAMVHGDIQAIKGLQTDNISGQVQDNDSNNLLPVIDV